MNTPLALGALCACVLLLGACDKKQAPPPTPKVSELVSTPSAATTGPAFDPSMPSMNPGTSAAKATPGPKDGTRAPSQESKSTPMPGQNNDHSAPLSPAKGASAP
jgi:hypothetical protein